MLEYVTIDYKVHVCILHASIDPKYEKDQQIIVDKILLSQFLTTTMLLHLMHTIPLTCSCIQV